MILLRLTGLSIVKVFLGVISFNTGFFIRFLIFEFTFSIYISRFFLSFFEETINLGNNY